MIKVMVVEDEPNIRDILKRMIEKQDGFEVVVDCGDFVSAVTEFTKKRPEVVFMDIDLNGESGMKCAKVISELSPDTKIIFATAHSEYMADAFEIYAFDYLVKPFNMERIAKTLQKITKGKEVTPIKNEECEKLLIKGKEQVQFIDINEIVLIEHVEKQTIITTDSDSFQTSASLSEIEGKLPEKQFIRCHKSYIIPFSKIMKVEPYGRWTYLVSLKGTETKALMTAAKYDEIKKRFE